MEIFFRKKSLTMPKKTERGTIWDFQKIFQKVSQSRKYFLAPLSFLNDIKILLRKLRIVRN